MKEQIKSLVEDYYSYLVHINRMEQEGIIEVKGENRGGKRPGAGRPALENPKKPFPLRVTAEESEKLKQYLIKLRKHD